MSKPQRQGMTIIEVLFAIAILTVAVFALLSVLSMGVRANRKSFNEMVAARVADRELNRVIFEALTNINTDIFDGDYPYPTSAAEVGNTTVGSDVYSYAIYADTVKRTDGTSVGSLSANKNLLKKVDIVVWWWSAEAGTRAGYGRLQTSMCRLVGQGDTP